MPRIEPPGYDPNQGGGGGQQPPPSNFFPGLPPELQERVAEFLRNGDEDGAMSFIRASAWYRDAYAGIQELMQAGIISNWANPEQEYATWKNNVMSTYQRYYGRVPTIEEIRNLGIRGLGAQQIEQVGAGHSYVEAHRPELSYLSAAFGSGGALTEEELKAYGEQQSGLGSTLGEKIKAKVELTMKKMESVFKGVQGSSIGFEQSLGETVKRRQRSDIGL